jgi:hypothetical protein
MPLPPPLDPADLEQAFTLYRLSRMLHVVATLDVANHLAGAPLDARRLAQLTDADASSLASVLDALVCWGVFDRDDHDRYALNRVSRRLVAGTENAANVPFLLGWAGWPATYEAFGNLLHTVRTGQGALGANGGGFHAYLAANPEMSALYDRAMDATAEGFAECADAYDFSGARTLVDVGGGQGAFCLEILQRNRQLRAVCLDVPEVVAKGIVGEHPAQDRLELIGGDAMTTVPPGRDLYVTSTVLRCFADDACLRLLKSVRAAMAPSSKLAAFEMIVPDRRDHLAVCMANVVARAVYGGKDRTESEFRALFAAADLRLVRTIPTAGTISVLEAVPA